MGCQGFAEFVFFHQRYGGHAAGLLEGVAFYEDGLVAKEFVEPFRRASSGCTILAERPDRGSVLEGTGDDVGFGEVGEWFTGVMGKPGVGVKK